MAFHHHHHHAASFASCGCGCYQPPPCHQCTTPPPPSLSADPLVVASVVSHLLQTPTQTPFSPHDFYSQTLKPSKINPNRRHPHRETDQFQHSHSGFFSLLERIDALEAVFHRFSCASSLSLRDAAARTIQTHFRAYLVRRSRALGQLKYLASIKSAVVSLKSSLSRRGFVDFGSLTSRAMELLHEVDSIQSDDQMIRDSKRSITNDIAQCLDLLNGVCVKRLHVKTKTTVNNMKLMRRNEEKSASGHGKGFSDRVQGSKSRNMSNEEKKLLENLKGRVQRISKLSRELEDVEEDAQMEGLKDEDVLVEDSVGIARNSCIYLVENEGSAKKYVVHPNGKNRVSFVEDDVDEITRGSSWDVENEDSSKFVQDDDREA